jgi:hypothetical protein
MPLSPGKNTGAYPTTRSASANGAPSQGSSLRWMAAQRRRPDGVPSHLGKASRGVWRHEFTRPVCAGGVVSATVQGDRNVPDEPLRHGPLVRRILLRLQTAQRVLGTRDRHHARGTRERARAVPHGPECRALPPQRLPHRRNVPPVFHVRRVSVLEEFRMSGRTGYNQQHEFDPGSTPYAVVSLASRRARRSGIAILLDALEPGGDLRRRSHRRRGPRGVGAVDRCPSSH